MSLWQAIQLGCMVGNAILIVRNIRSVRQCTALYGEFEDSAFLRYRRWAFFGLGWSSFFFLFSTFWFFGIWV